MTQKELKALYADELRKVWNDEKMIKFCSNDTAYIIEHNGKLYGIEKPRIDKDFCYGYGFNGISDKEDETEADRMSRKAQTDKDYFINKNLEDINRWIRKLSEILEDMRLNWSEGSHPRYMITIGSHYINQPEDCKLNYYAIADTFGGSIRGEICNDTELLEKLIKGYEEVKTDFIKRLQTYLKRYGLSKVRSWTYLRD